MTTDEEGRAAGALAALDLPLRPPTLPPGDVSYAVDDTPVGRLLLAATSEGALVACSYAPDAETEDAWLQRIADAVSPRVLRHPRQVDPARRELAAYLAGEVHRFTVALDIRLMPAFQRRVLTGLAERVGYGERTTYGALAARLGSPGASRAVGTALARNPLCLVLPCHRVVPAAGGVGGYAGGPAVKERLLALEAAHRPTT